MYHLKNCGLPNVWLENGYKTGADKFGGYYSFEDSAGLYKAIALALAHGNEQLSADELRFIRRQLTVSQQSLGAMLGRTDQTVLLWERRGNIPADAARQIKLILLRQLVPSISLEKAFKHIEQSRQETILLVRTKNQWHSCASEPIEYSTRNFLQIHALLDSSQLEQEQTVFPKLNRNVVLSYKAQDNLEWFDDEFSLNNITETIETKCKRTIQAEAPVWRH